jgi:hypothetical protein
MTEGNGSKKPEADPPLAEKGVKLTPEQERSRRARNLAIGVAIALFGGLFYFVTIAKLGGGVARMPR